MLKAQHMTNAQLADALEGRGGGPYHGMPHDIDLEAAKRLRFMPPALSRIECQAIYDALAFTARGSGCVSDAHNRAVDHVCRALGLPIEPDPA
jgi:hypothetical protein